MKITKHFSLTFITSITSILLLNGCVSKNSNGSYSSTYSYHSYNINSQNQNIRENQYNNNHQRYYRSPQINRNIEQTARALLGTDYKYGANGPHQYDCSSFTKHVFSRQGINLPRVSKEQAKVGKFIRFSQLRKGDLIFFDSKSSSAISHVGIYLDSGKFIHASSSKDRVIISNLQSNYYSSHFKWGRRVISTAPTTLSLR